jgi:hypothetical protein
MVVSDGYDNAIDDRAGRSFLELFSSLEKTLEEMFAFIWIGAVKVKL